MTNTTKEDVPKKDMTKRNPLRIWLSRKIYYWADRKYGVKARSGQYPFTVDDHKKQSKWRFWMKIKNIIFGRI